VKGATRHRKLGLRLTLLAAVAVVAAGVALGLRSTQAIESLELDTVDARYSLRGEKPPRDDVVIVALDDLTLREIAPSGAVPRRVHARLIERLASARPKLIAYDAVFPGPKDRAGDLALLRAMAATRNLVLAAGVAGDRPGTVAGLRTARQLGARPGDVKGTNDTDGVYRQMPYYTNPKSFPVVAAELAQGRPINPDRFPDGEAWIDYSGPPGAIPQHSFSRVVDRKLPAETFRGKIVLVGATAPLLKDVFPTPVSADPMPGIEIHANSLATILNGFPLEDATDTLDLLLTLLMSVLAPLVAIRLSAPFVVAAGLLGAAAYLGASQLAFNAGTILPITPPLAGLMVGAAGATAVDILVESRAQRRLRQTFERFVPKDIVKEVLARANNDLRLGGEMLEATVLFCDLRGFSRFGERHDAAVVIQALNRYLTEMSDAVFAHGGTVVSYMGDGMMAVFGAPIEQHDHPDRAYAAAREMLERRLPAFNDWIERQGFGEPFRMGIGLCTGPVMSGNVGSSRRVEYAAVGNTTNLAARLEEKNKELGSQLLMSESTRTRLNVPDEELTAEGEQSLAGRSGSLKVWSLSSARLPADADARSPASSAGQAR
jgi:adenylate cyclase